MAISIFLNHLSGFWSSVLLLLVLVRMLSFMLGIRDCPHTGLRMHVGIWKFCGLSPKFFMGNAHMDTRGP